MALSIRNLDLYQVQREIDLYETLCSLIGKRGSGRQRPGDQRRKKTYRQRLRRLKKRLRQLPLERSPFGNIITRSLMGTLDDCYHYASRLGMDQLHLPTPENDRSVALFWDEQTLQLLLYCEGDLVHFQCSSGFTFIREMHRIRDFYNHHG